MEDPFEKVLAIFTEVKLFFSELSSFLIKKLHFSFLHFENRKGVFVTALYRQRGKMARRLIHSGMAGLTALGVMIAPVVAQEFPGRAIDPWSEAQSGVPAVLSASVEDNTKTLVSDDKTRGEIVEYLVQEGDTVSTIAEKFGVSEDTIRWQNNLSSKDAIKVGQALEILPVTGISHKVNKGDTIYSIAKKYDVDAQEIVNYPFNTYTNDETFELAIGQTVIIPGGVEPAVVLWSPLARIRQITPDAGTVVASGSFVWPAGGSITSGFVWYHQGLDIANRAAPAILAADNGTVVTSGWSPYGYGNHVVVDHGNGYRTLYAHMSQLYVNVGQSVARGNALGKMGSTGRSTGIHLHFEVIRNGVHVSPLSVLK